ncbi:hypothetical protein AA11826_1420 [Komagataeibacter oboediens DSM 11826]|nr:hypothetical protein AA11826_1420 [Komagataeibacter oboediens DSM 11826]
MRDETTRGINRELAVRGGTARHIQSAPHMGLSCIVCPAMLTNGISFEYILAQSFMMYHLNNSVAVSAVAGLCPVVAGLPHNVWQAP